MGSDWSLHVCDKLVPALPALLVFKTDELICQSYFVSWGSLVPSGQCSACLTSSWTKQESWCCLSLKMWGMYCLISSSTCLSGLENHKAWWGCVAC